VDLHPEHPAAVAVHDHRHAVAAAGADEVHVPERTRVEMRRERAVDDEAARAREVGADVDRGLRPEDARRRRRRVRRDDARARDEREGRDESFQPAGHCSGHLLI
jgi:hypothetical protein